jgi:cysteine-rich repeat protein
VPPPPVCGDGIREAGEQCDDGNLVDLDGCDSTCKFEQVTRATQLAIQWAHDTFCTADVLFEAVKDPPFANVHSTLQGNLNTAVTNGSDNVVLKYFSITDLTGQSGTASVGSYNALATTYTGAFTGNADLDWWYSLDTKTAGGSPLFTPTVKQSTGTFTAGVLTATGGHVLVSAFGVSLWDLANVKLQLPIAKPATKPTASTGASPGHLASENLDPALTSFATAGGTNAAPTGMLCGNTTAASLAGTVVPAQLQTNCNEGFNGMNNMLDVFVRGCTSIVGPIIAVTQPDQINPDAPAAGAGGPYTFQLTGNQVTACKDKSGVTQTTLGPCEAAAAYSSYLKMAMDRVILKHP